MTVTVCNSRGYEHPAAAACTHSLPPSLPTYCFGYGCMRLQARNSQVTFPSSIARASQGCGGRVPALPVHGGVVSWERAQRYDEG